VHSRLVKPYSLLVVVSVQLLVTFGIAFYVGYEGCNKEKKRMLKSDNVMATLLSTFITERRKAEKGVLQSYASRPLFVAAIRNRDSGKALFHLSQLTETHYEMDRPFVTDKNGILVFSSPFDKAALPEIERNKGLLCDAEVAEARAKLFREKRFIFG
jgi:hypothetical protein